jgi:ankyrin repeat protein
MHFLSPCEKLKRNQSSGRVPSGLKVVRKADDADSHNVKPTFEQWDEMLRNNHVKKIDIPKTSLNDIEEQNNLKQANPRKHYLPLYKAAIQGNWDAASEFFSSDPQSITAGITDNLETVVHIAIGSKKNVKFLQMLLEYMTTDDAALLVDCIGRTPLHFAAIFGNVEAAKLLIQKVRNFPNIAASDNQLPIHYAARHGQREMVSFLLPSTTSCTNEPGPLLLDLIIGAEFYSKWMMLA